LKRDKEGLKTTGRGCELLKTVSTRIALHFPKCRGSARFFRIDQ